MPDMRNVIDNPQDIESAVKLVSSMGRNEDTTLAHVTPNEVEMLRKAGGSGSFNPATGLLEFFVGGAAEGGGTGSGEGDDADDPGPDAGGQSDADISQAISNAQADVVAEEAAQSTTLSSVLQSVLDKVIDDPVTALQNTIAKAVMGPLSVISTFTDPSEDTQSNPTAQLSDNSISAGPADEGSGVSGPVGDEPGNLTGTQVEQVAENVAEEATAESIFDQLFNQVLQDKVFKFAALPEFELLDLPDTEI